MVFPQKNGTQPTSTSSYKFLGIYLKNTFYFHKNTWSNMFMLSRSLKQPQQKKKSHTQLLKKKNNTIEIAGKLIELEKLSEWVNPEPERSIWWVNAYI